MQWGRWSYKPVGHAPDPSDPEADERAVDVEQQQQPPGGTGTRRRRVGLVPLAAATTAVLLLLLLVLAPSTPRPRPTRRYACGRSARDAEAAGCRFDVASYAWVHPACFDQELTYEFLGSAPPGAAGGEGGEGGGWTWYEDEGGARALGLAEVARGRRERVYVTWGYYAAHCTYVWKKMHRSLLTSRSLDSYVSDYRHTEQCQRVLLDRDRDPDSMGVMLVVKYPSCPIVSD